jgi:hypothetical protein
VFLLNDLRGPWQLDQQSSTVAGRARKKLSATYANQADFPKSLFLTINLTV